jgi:MOSC domain-containing protein YiiM
MLMDCTEAINANTESQTALKQVGHRWGVVAGLFVGPRRKELMISVPEVRAIAGCGLEGDRYCREAGTFSRKSPSNQMTLVEMEALDAVAQDYGFSIAAEELRRNVLTCGMALNHLVGREFTIGGIRLRGLRLCEPCSHLEQLTGKQMIKALRHRGGLRAEILNDGMIKVGDIITETN